MAKSIYPLAQVLEVKQKRVEDAEKVVKEKKGILDQEQEKLKQREAERDKVAQHYRDKMVQMRSEMDHGTSSPKILQMRAYLKVVTEKLKTEEKKVKEQQNKVDLAKKELETARQQLAIKRQEVDKLETHRKDWEKEMRKEEDICEEREQDELGGIIYTINQRKNS